LNTNIYSNYLIIQPIEN